MSQRPDDKTKPDCNDTRADRETGTTSLVLNGYIIARFYTILINIIYFNFFALYSSTFFFNGAHVKKYKIIS